MTDQELNIKMAELDGWQLLPFEGEEADGGYSVWRNPDGFFVRGEPPEYTEDYNSIIAAEIRKGLKNRENPGLRVKWQNSVHKALSAAADCPKNKLGSALVSDIDCLLMTARQRAEAFVLTFFETKVKS